MPELALLTKRPLFSLIHLLLDINHLPDKRFVKDVAFDKLVFSAASSSYSSGMLGLGEGRLILGFLLGFAPSVACIRCSGERPARFWILGGLESLREEGDEGESIQTVCCITFWATCLKTG
jgi:hypothetical protein